jgi:hypothetical protein
VVGYGSSRQKSAPKTTRRKLRAERSAKERGNAQGGIGSGWGAASNNAFSIASLFGDRLGVISSARSFRRALLGAIFWDNFMMTDPSP